MEDQLTDMMDYLNNVSPVPSDDFVEDQIEEDRQLAFVVALSNYTVLLQKSQKPETKDLKAKAMSNFKAELERTSGSVVDMNKVAKKIANMKKTVKDKSDKSKTGNKKIVLKPWETKMLQLLQADINPVFNKLAKSMSCGILTPSNTIRDDQQAGSSSFSSRISNSQFQTPPSLKRKRLPAETKETEQWSNNELQRQVMLEQLNYYRRKNANLSKDT